MRSGRFECALTSGRRRSPSGTASPMSVARCGLGAPAKRVRRDRLHGNSDSETAAPEPRPAARITVRHSLHINSCALTRHGRPENEGSRAVGRRKSSNKNRDISGQARSMLIAPSNRTAPAKQARTPPPLYMHFDTFGNLTDPASEIQRVIRMESVLRGTAQSRGRPHQLEHLDAYRGEPSSAE